MKALKIDSTIHTDQIVSAITDCYATDTEPSNTELLALYSTIGQCICAQGEKAFVVHLAQALAELLPQIKGFSPRNLRRMRDFYRTYENQPELMHKAQSIGWTQNTVILDYCETDEQRSFYITLALEKKLSKLALLKAIELNALETDLSAETDQNTIATVCPTVSDADTEEAIDTTSTIEKPCGAFVTACDPLRQGSGLPDMKTQHNTIFGGAATRTPPKPLKIENKQQKRSPHQASCETVKLLTFLYKTCRLRMHNGNSPPNLWRDFRMDERNLTFS